MATATLSGTRRLVDSEPIYTGAMSAYPYSDALASRYIFKTPFGDLVDMAVRQGNTLLVPRATAPIGKQDYRKRHHPAAIDCTFTPRNDEQLPLANKSIQLLRCGFDHIFRAPTGWGKTVVGSYIAAKLGQPTMIVVTKQDLMDQWKKALIEVLGIPPYLVGTVQQNTCDWIDKRFVVGMVQSLVIPDRYPPEMYSHYGMLMLDEVHQMAADTFIRACQMFPAYHRLGLSATPDRTDGKTRVLHAHIGPEMVTGSIVPMAPKVLVKKTGWKIPDEIDYAPGRMTIVTKLLGGNHGRNKEIAKFTVDAFHAERRTLILSDLKDGHLVKLFHHIVAAGISGEEIGYYVGGMKADELARTKTRRVVLGTYQMCATGTDVPAWDTLVLASPRADVKQSIGRVMRFATGKKQPVILDLLDFNKIFHGFHLKRLKTYAEVKATIVQMG